MLTNPRSVEHPCRAPGRPRRKKKSAQQFADNGDQEDNPKQLPIPPRYRKLLYSRIETKNSGIKGRVPNGKIKGPRNVGLVLRTLRRHIQGKYAP